MLKPLPNQALFDELLTFAPELAAYYVSHVERMYNNLVAVFGPTFRTVVDGKRFAAANERRWCKSYQTVSRFTRSVDPKSYRPDQPQELDMERLQSFANGWAEGVVTQWHGKMCQKLAQIENPKVHRVSGYSFNIEGTRNGHRVQILQDMIVNRSPHNTIFNQWPSRIYVDGKFTSAAKYAKALAE